MKTLGMIGGLGPESTVDYYRRLLTSFHSKRPDLGNPRIVFASVDFHRMMALVDRQDWQEMASWLAGEFELLAAAGADIGLISANTPHIAFDSIRDQSPIPLISIVEATCDVAKEQALSRVGLLGTKTTMQGTFFPKVFSRHGIELAVPNLTDQEYVHEKYFGELFKGVFLEETRQGLLRVAHRMIERDAVQGLILGGTELPLILRDASELGIPLLDTTEIHVQRAVEQMLL